MVVSAVWARMKGFSPWPGKVCTKLDISWSYCLYLVSYNFRFICVNFFGTNDFAWIEEFSIKDYEQFRHLHQEQTNQANDTGHRGD